MRRQLCSLLVFKLPDAKSQFQVTHKHGDSSLPQESIPMTCLLIFTLLHKIFFANVQSTMGKDEMSSKECFRHTNPKDLPLVVHTLTRAFAEDPLVNYLVEYAKYRQKPMATLFKLYFKIGQENWVRHDGMAAALWEAPGNKIGLGTYLSLIPMILFSMGLKSTPRSLKAMVATAKVHPKERHYYLMAVGVDPSLQGQGIGSKILTPTLNKCDQENTGSYLETSNPRNLPFYERLGFKITEEIKIEREAPTLFLMWRDPKPE